MRNLDTRDAYTVRSGDEERRPGKTEKHLLVTETSSGLDESLIATTSTICRAMADVPRRKPDLDGPPETGVGDNQITMSTMPMKTVTIKTLVAVALTDPADDLAAEHSVSEIDTEETIPTIGMYLLSDLVTAQETLAVAEPLSLSDECMVVIGMVTEAIGGLNGDISPQRSMTMTTTRRTMNFQFNDRGVDVADGDENRDGLEKQSCS